MKVRVRATVEVEVEFEDHPNFDPIFHVEENGCPGSGAVGSAIERKIRESRQSSVCWACPWGENKVIAINGAPVNTDGMLTEPTIARISDVLLRSGVEDGEKLARLLERRIRERGDAGRATPFASGQVPTGLSTGAALASLHCRCTPLDGNEDCPVHTASTEPGTPSESPDSQE